MAGGYAILGYYPSSSSSATYEVRRGGDGVLYCTCRGWVSNLNRVKRDRAGAPAECKHTKIYVKDPGRFTALRRGPSSVPSPTWTPHPILYRNNSLHHPVQRPCL